MEKSDWQFIGIVLALCVCFFVGFVIGGKLTENVLEGEIIKNQEFIEVEIQKIKEDAEWLVVMKYLVDQTNADMETLGAEIARIRQYGKDGLESDIRMVDEKNGH